MGSTSWSTVCQSPSGCQCKTTPFPGTSFTIAGTELRAAVLPGSSMYRKGKGTHVRAPSLCRAQDTCCVMFNNCLSRRLLRLQQRHQLRLAGGSRFPEFRNITPHLLEEAGNLNAMCWRVCLTPTLVKKQELHSSWRLGCHVRWDGCLLIYFAWSGGRRLKLFRLCLAPVLFWFLSHRSVHG